MFISFTITHHSPCIAAVWENPSDRQGLIGLFNVSQNNTNQQYIEFNNLPDGKYQNLLFDLGIKDISKSECSTITVSNNGKISVPPVAVIFHYSDFILQPQMFYSELFDFNYKGM